MQATKSGQLFVLDRATGTPVFPVEERAVPASQIFGEQASPTQPFNTVLPPLSPQHYSIDDVWGPTPELREQCRQRIEHLRNDGPFTPPSLEGTLVTPSNVGGAHWGGVAFDPASQTVIVPVNRIAAHVQLVRLDQYDSTQAATNASRLGDQYTRMHGTPYVLRRNLLRMENGLPCTPPPWGALVAIDLNSGTKAWEVPLGDPALLRPQLRALSSVPLGLPNLGGPIITASGLTFIGASFDRALRAFDIRTGQELWRGTLPAGARATPATYEAGGRQFVIIAAGGGDDWGAGDYLVAFALPRTASSKPAPGKAR
jgi:quinoprotein glucose dehydrogenase